MSGAAIRAFTPFGIRSIFVYPVGDGIVLYIGQLVGRTALLLAPDPDGRPASDEGKKCQNAQPDAEIAACAEDRQRDAPTKQEKDLEADCGDGDDQDDIK